MDTVKFDKDKYATLVVIREHCDKRPTSPVVTVSNKNEKRTEVKEVPTRQYLMEKLGLKSSTIRDRLQFLEKAGLISYDFERSYPFRKTWAWFYKITDDGYKWIAGYEAFSALSRNSSKQ